MNYFQQLMVNTGLRVRVPIPERERHAPPHIIPAHESVQNDIEEIHEEIIVSHEGTSQSLPSDTTGPLHRGTEPKTMTTPDRDARTRTGSGDTQTSEVRLTSGDQVPYAVREVIRRIEPARPTSREEGESYRRERPIQTEGVEAGPPGTRKGPEAVADLHPEQPAAPDASELLRSVLDWVKQNERGGALPPSLPQVEPQAREGTVARPASTTPEESVPTYVIRGETAAEKRATGRSEPHPYPPSIPDTHPPAEARGPSREMAQPISPQGEHVTEVSIGSIHLTVEGPPPARKPAIRAPREQRVPARGDVVSDRLGSRLRRLYIVPPFG
jgi:hypothetical protein